VVTVTGSGRQNRDESSPGRPRYRPFRQIADTLGRRGIATLRLDDRGVGGSDPGPEGATSSDFADDIRAAVAYLRRRPEIDPARVALVGHSEGGVIAPMVAATDSLLAGVVLLAGPAYTLRRVNRFQRMQELDPDGRLTTEEIERELDRTQALVDEEAMDDPWRAAAWVYDPIPTARAVRAPVLILHGESDRQISLEQADTLAAAFRSGGDPDVTLKTFRNTNHFFLEDPEGRMQGLASYELRPEILGSIAEWLAAHLR
jgi:dipeptidyl aminopeptidase/acylaminoacyl peptidase